MSIIKIEDFLLFPENNRNRCFCRTLRDLIFLRFLKILSQSFAQFLPFLRFDFFHSPFIYNKVRGHRKNLCAILCDAQVKVIVLCFFRITSGVARHRSLLHRVVRQDRLGRLGLRRDQIRRNRLLAGHLS